MSSDVRFTVPYLIPPSGNHYKIPTHYTDARGNRHLGFKITKHAKAYYDAVTIFARGASLIPHDPREWKHTRYRVVLDVYLGRGQRGDFDNFWKTGLDALVKTGIIHSDAAVDGMESRCAVHKDQRDNPRTEYQIWRLEPHGKS